MSNDKERHAMLRPDHPPLVSVVMPAFNSARYVRRAMGSVLAQTLENLELVVVDDASSDDTVAVIQACGDPRVRVIRNARNRGPAYSRNVGLAAASGDWIALLDADDWMAPDRLEVLLGLAQQRNADAVADDLFIIDDGSARPRSTLFLEAGCAVRDGTWLSVNDMIVHEVGALKPMFKRALFACRGHRYDTGLRYGEDYHLYLGWLLDGARMMVLREPRYYLRRGSTGSLTTARAQMAAASLALNQRLLADPRLEALPEARQALRRRVDKVHDLLVFYAVVCPLRALQPVSAVRALLESPRFIAVALRRLPGIVALRLHRIAYRLHQASRAAAANPVQAGQDIR